jgi:ABC-type polysaccharide/polyol phosphate transport system ATPase subunit
MSAIVAKNLGKKYRKTANTAPTLYGKVRDLIKRVEPEEFWAIREADFAVEPGTTVGIIGPNGAGKSSTLGLAAGTITPTEGSITCTGQVSALLELGAGFHADLTGRENVYLNAALMGIPREVVEERFEQIVAFSELGHFIDEPVKTYSSGMYVRLGFAVATEVDPDVLLVDEVLAVGDINFQKKCFRRFGEIKARGKAILFVSHDLRAVEVFCDEVLLVENGYITHRGNPPEVIHEYYKKYVDPDAERKVHVPVQTEAEKKAASEDKLDQTYSDEDFEVIDSDLAADHYHLLKHEHGTQEIEFRNILFLDEFGDKADTFKMGRPMHIDILYEAHARIENPVFGFGIKKATGEVVWGTNTQNQQITIDAVEGKGAIRLTIDPLNLWAGTHKLSLSIHSQDHLIQYHRREDWYEFDVIAGDHGEGPSRLASHWTVHQ